MMKAAIILTAILAASLAVAFFSGNSPEEYSRTLRLVSIFAGIGALIVLSSRRKPSTPKNLLDIPIINRVARSRIYKPLLQIPSLAIFLVVLYFSFFGIAYGPLNFATAFTWILWWAAIIFTFVLIGRIWCTACPFAVFGDLFQKVVSLNKKFPYKLRNMGLQIGLFLLLTWAFVIFGVVSSPLLTGIFIIILIGGAVVFSGVFEKRTFCKYICPIGALIGLYSLTSPVELRSKDKQVCCDHLQKDCYKACPMMEYMGKMETNFNCNFCMECVKACPKNNIRLSLRSFGSDLVNNKKIGIITTLAASLLLGVSLFQTLAMMGIWGTVLSFAATTIGLVDFNVVFTILFLSLVVVAPLVVFSFFSAVSSLLGKTSFRSVFASFGLLLIPQGVAVHLAHNLNHLLIEGASLPSVVQFSFTPGSVNWASSSLLQVSQVFWLQAIIIFLGFFLAIATGVGISRNKFQSLKPFLPIFALLLLINLISLYLIGLPMDPRHVH